MRRKSAPMSKKMRATWTGLAKGMRAALEEGTTETLCLALAHTIETTLAAKDEKTTQEILRTWSHGDYVREV